MDRTPTDSTGAEKGNLKSYINGFIISTVLTILSFAVVMSGALRVATLAIIFSAAVIQILAHLHYFLHLDASSRSSWNLLALLFTVLILTLFVGGTIFIMNDLGQRMM